MATTEMTQAALMVIQFAEMLYNPQYNSNKYKWTINVLNEAARLEKEIADRSIVTRESETGGEHPSEF
jgi:diphthamide biosynthesis methyltransferase